MNTLIILATILALSFVVIPEIWSIVAARRNRRGGTAMTDRWRVSFEIWAYSTPEGGPKDRAAAGGGHAKFEFRAASIADAVEIGLKFQRALKLNPRVWQAQIVKVEMILK